jgi:hypothetical protein
MPQTNLFGEQAAPLTLAQEKARSEKLPTAVGREKKTEAILGLVIPAPSPGATPRPASEDAYLRDFWAGEGEPGTDVREFVTFSARLLKELPDAWEMRCLFGEHRLVFATAPTKDWARHEIPCFLGDEWLAAVIGVENDRVLPDDVQGWLSKKKRNARWELSEKIAMDGCYHDEKPGWQTWRALSELGMRLKTVVYP